MIIKFDDFINEELENGVTLLRKLSRKSILNFGKHTGLSVQQVLDLRNPGYLRYLYYNVNGISFLDDILQEIGIMGYSFDYRIDKPGTNPELGKEVDENRHKHLDLKQRARVKRVSRGKAISNKIGLDKRNAIRYSKGSLARINQGHR